ncbi:putative glycosyl transferase, family 14 [Helianthus annuus]|nr:putative glycosyl transferase, family 14 [Helianthus annuus]KAJ0635138.1 putative glycosyl transferase, family 14 [Helianthus annuus]KAJ0811792.1 putative glycosyl transferase, family 14 [Helianthus annuus]KAJ0824887.1 putative glycosyl transferase, family 14 [Helianthus annuus]
MEAGKDPAITATVITRSNQTRAALPQRLIHLLALFLVLCFTISLFSIYMIRKTGVVTTVTSAIPILQSCIQEQPNNDLDRWITPPSNLMHAMSDKELFWRASFMPQVKKYPFTRVPKIAFMFLTKGPIPLAPLWERFFKGHKSLFTIYIHSLPSYEPRFPSTSVFYNRQIPSQIAEWGRMSMCDAERRLLANALLDISNEYFILVSESCIPVYNFTTIYRYITRSKYSFMGAFDDPGPFGRGRYNPNMLPEVNISEWRKGSQWFEVNRKLASIIISDTMYYPKFLNFCRPACYVDEHYFPTLLTIQAPNLLANRSLTWVDWSRGGPHPATFGANDITEGFMMKLHEKRECVYNDKPSSVCYLFARKFAPSTLQRLLLFAHEFLGY